MSRPQKPLNDFLNYFVRLWRPNKGPTTRFVVIMHRINRSAIVVFLVGVVFFLTHKCAA